MENDKNIEQKIIKLFLYNDSLKFNQIGREIGERTNKVSYHIKNLTQKGILVKENEKYKLSETSEYLIPYISERKHALPVVLVHIGTKKEAFLIKRKKRPFKNKLALPGGRLQTGESIEESAKRIMKEKFNIEIQEPKTKSVSLEHVKKNNKTHHSFMLVCVKTKTKDKIKTTSIEENKENIISSDYKLIKETSKNPEIKELETEADKIYK